MLLDAVICVVEEGAGATQLVGCYGHVFLVQLSDVDAGVVEDVALVVVQERIAIVIELDAIDLLCHGGAVDFHSHDSDELTFPVNRDVVGDHARV